MKKSPTSLVLAGALAGFLATAALSSAEEACTVRVDVPPPDVHVDCLELIYPGTDATHCADSGTRVPTADSGRDR